MDFIRSVFGWITYAVETVAYYIGLRRAVEDDSNTEDSVKASNPSTATSKTKTKRNKSSNDSNKHGKSKSPSSSSSKTDHNKKYAVSHQTQQTVKPRTEQRNSRNTEKKLQQQKPTQLHSKSNTHTTADNTSKAKSSKSCDLNAPTYLQKATSHPDKTSTSDAIPKQIETTNTTTTEKDTSPAPAKTAQQIKSEKTNLSTKKNTLAAENPQCKSLSTVKQISPQEATSKSPAEEKSTNNKVSTASTTSSSEAPPASTPLSPRKSSSSPPPSYKSLSSNTSLSTSKSSHIKNTPSKSSVLAPSVPPTFSSHIKTIPVLKESSPSNCPTNVSNAKQEVKQKNTSNTEVLDAGEEIVSTPCPAKDLPKSSSPFKGEESSVPTANLSGSISTSTDISFFKPLISEASTQLSISSIQSSSSNPKQSYPLSPSSPVSTLSSLAANFVPTSELLFPEPTSQVANPSTSKAYSNLATAEEFSIRNTDVSSTPPEQTEPTKIVPDTNQQSSYEPDVPSTSEQPSTFQTRVETSSTHLIDNESESTLDDSSSNKEASSTSEKFSTDEEPTTSEIRVEATSTPRQQQLTVTTSINLVTNQQPCSGVEDTNNQDFVCQRSVEVITDKTADSMTIDTQQVRVLTLEKGQNLESKLFRLQKGWTVQFRRGASLFGRTVSLSVNCPATANDSFERSCYRPLPWRSDNDSTADDTALYAQLTLAVAGSFRYAFTVAGCPDGSSGGSGYLLVDPSLTIGRNDASLPFDCLQCQTVLSKNLGAFPDWRPRLRVAKESGYNMVHFTPIQTLGVSNSGYSLSDQHDLNVTFHAPGKKCSLEDVEKLIKEMKNDWNMLSLTDIVLNHTANESPWLEDHPDAVYSVHNSPHLRPAYLIDRALYYCSQEVSAGKLQQWLMPPDLCTEEQLAALSSHILNLVLLPLNIHEFYSADTDEVVAEFRQRLACQPPSTEPRGALSLALVQDPQFRRLKCSVDFNVALRLYNVALEECSSEQERVDRCCDALRAAVDTLNKAKWEECLNHLHAAVAGTLGTIRYERIHPDGPKLLRVTAKNPLVPLYFTHRGADTDVATDEQLSYSADSCYLMAHNGWVMGSHDPLNNFAEPGYDVYLRRELVAWGDSVKLRYGSKPADNPYLWDHMRRYCEYTARIFHGIRLDNCHSTPIHVAEYLLDAARRVRPDLYVIAELFTNSDDTDNVFVNRLGINSLIREAMSAPNSHEVGRLVYRYGGEPVGAFLLPPVRPLVPSVAHAILLDLSHDNKSPAEVRTAYDMLPSTALVSMACCATGSNRGYDELVPHHIHVVDESRLYTSWSDTSAPGGVSAGTGIVAAKKMLNDLHCQLGRDGFSQVFVDQVTEDVVTVTRHNPVTHDTVILVAYTAFRPPAQIAKRHIRPLKVQGQLQSVLFELEQRPADENDWNKQFPGAFVRDAHLINGLTDMCVTARQCVPLSDARLVCAGSADDPSETELHYTDNFRPGSVVALRFSLLPAAQQAVNNVRKTLAEFSYKPRLQEVSLAAESGLLPALCDLDLVSLNRCLYHCDQEEKDEGHGWGVYDVPGWRPLVYCGLQGLESVLYDIRVNNDLGHPVCGNLRSGDWLMDYTCDRLILMSSTAPVGQWLKSVVNDVKQVPRYLIPAYFDAVANKLYLALINRAWQLMAKFISQGSVFGRQLGLCSIQFVSVVPSAQLPRLSPNLRPPVPVVDADVPRAPSIAAGLPHFCQGYMRNWGRDTFIALPGNLLIPGRYDEARWVILGFAATLRHGLIPNLLDGGPKARFNCRDAVWFWLMAVQKYVETVPEGHLLLQDKVSRLFPRDDSEPQQPGAADQTLAFIIQEALTRHFQGVSFRERNAGLAIDEQMTDAGFNNCIGVDLDTGFPFGGNVNNCGTWMDKMGSSEHAGNKGRPATPRDGSAVEIVGLCKAAVTFLAKMYKAKKYTYQGVVRVDEKGNEINWTYSFWAQQLQCNFEKHFYVDPDVTKDKRPDLVNKKGIFKDSVGASNLWPDYQLRCNFPIALAVAPELVDPSRGLAALDVVEEMLLGPLGIKTLDPSDWNYRPDYRNSDDSNDSSVARGFNYHQGPEWVWPVGYLLRARLALSRRLVDSSHQQQTLSRVKSKLSDHFRHLLSHEWRSLPELTNAGGQPCFDSNPAQSWSTGCILEVLWEMDQMERGASSC